MSAAQCICRPTPNLFGVYLAEGFLSLSNQRKQTRDSWSQKFKSVPTIRGSRAGVRIGIKRLLNDLIRHMRTVKVTGIDVVHAGRNRLSQHSNRSVNVTGRSQMFFEYSVSWRAEVRYQAHRSGKHVRSSAGFGSASCRGACVCNEAPKSQH